MNQSDCIIIGGGIAGLQAAIQLGRYNHKVLVIDSNRGRSSIAGGYHNILGWPEGISGPELRSRGKKHAEKYGVTFIDAEVTHLNNKNGHFLIKTANHEYDAKTVFLGTGLVDYLPVIENLYLCLGKSIFVCSDCDGYEVSNKRTIVLGNGNTGARTALTLTYWTKNITFINHGMGQINEELSYKLKQNNIPVINEEISRILLDLTGQFSGVLLKNGQKLNAERGFTGFSGNKLNNSLAKQVGIQLNESNHVVVNARTKETNVEGIWAGGDLIAHSEQVTISMGDGSQAAIWIHKRLLGHAPPI